MVFRQQKIVFYIEILGGGRIPLFVSVLFHHFAGILQRTTLTNFQINLLPFKKMKAPIAQRNRLP